MEKIFWQSTEASKEGEIWRDLPISISHFTNLTFNSFVFQLTIQFLFLVKIQQHLT